MRAWIESAAWNQQWSNTELSTLRDAASLFTLMHHTSLAPQFLSDMSLFSILLMASFTRVVRQSASVKNSTSDGEKEVSPLIRILEQKALDVTRGLDAHRASLFRDFCSKYLSVMEEEFQKVVG